MPGTGPDRSRGTPRVANSRLWWARNYSASEADGRITLEVAQAALDMAEVDRHGLDKQDRHYLETLVGVFEGGPTGVEAIAATMNLPSDTLSDEIGPVLAPRAIHIRTFAEGGGRHPSVRVDGQIAAERGTKPVCLNRSGNDYHSTENPRDRSKVCSINHAG